MLPVPELAVHEMYEDDQWSLIASSDPFPDTLGVCVAPATDPGRRRAVGQLEPEEWSRLQNTMIRLKDDTPDALADHTLRRLVDNGIPEPVLRSFRSHFVGWIQANRKFTKTPFEDAS